MEQVHENNITVILRHNFTAVEILSECHKNL